MTTIYFVRHAESDHSVRDARSRPLTAKGLSDCALVTDFLKNKNIDIIFSSPYKRAVDTIKGYAETAKLQINNVEDFRERENAWVEDPEDWLAFSKNQWADFLYKLPGGECLKEVQERNITALRNVLNRYKDRNIVIGTHGTALSTIINYYDKSYGFTDFMDMVYLTPWIVRMDYDLYDCIAIEKINLFD